MEGRKEGIDKNTKVRGSQRRRKMEEKQNGICEKVQKIEYVYRQNGEKKVKINNQKGCNTKEF